MSSSSSYMIIGASAMAENIFHGLLHRKASERQVMMVARITLLVMFIFGIVVAFDQNSSIFQVVSYAWAGLGASFGPLILTSLYWRRTNKYGAIAGMLSGTATVLIWHNFVKPLGGLFAIYELLPAFIVSLLFIAVVSLLTPAPSDEVLHEFDHYLDDPNDQKVDDDLVAAEIAAGERRAKI
ncbi:MAG: sodium:proline symporter, partial [Bifidobacterium ruminantium]|nr:sodium:proline symporter [Bifidobacterium ruminantium]